MVYQSAVTNGSCELVNHRIIPVMISFWQHFGNDDLFVIYVCHRGILSLTHGITPDSGQELKTSLAFRGLDSSRLCVF